MKINNTAPTSLQHAQQLLNNITNKSKSFIITVSQDQKRCLHYKHGIPMLFFDQLAIISKYLSQIKHNQNDNIDPTIN